MTDSHVTRVSVHVGVGLGDAIDQFDCYAVDLRYRVETSGGGEGAGAYATHSVVIEGVEPSDDAAALAGVIPDLPGYLSDQDVITEGLEVEWHAQQARVRKARELALSLAAAYDVEEVEK